MPRKLATQPSPAQYGDSVSGLVSTPCQTMSEDLNPKIIKHMSLKCKAFHGSSLDRCWNAFMEIWSKWFWVKMLASPNLQEFSNKSCGFRKNNSEAAAMPPICILLAGRGCGEACTLVKYNEVHRSTSKYIGTLLCYISLFSGCWW